MWTKRIHVIIKTHFPLNVTYCVHIYHLCCSRLVFFSHLQEHYICRTAENRNWHSQWNSLLVSLFYTRVAWAGSLNKSRRFVCHHSGFDWEDHLGDMFCHQVNIIHATQTNPMVLIGQCRRKSEKSYQSVILSKPSIHHLKQALWVVSPYTVFTVINNSESDVAMNCC